MAAARRAEGSVREAERAGRESRSPHRSGYPAFPRREGGQRAPLRREVTTGVTRPLAVPPGIVGLTARTGRARARARARRGSQL